MARRSAGIAARRFIDSIYAGRETLANDRGNAVSFGESRIRGGRENGATGASDAYAASIRAQSLGARSLHPLPRGCEGARLFVRAVSRLLIPFGAAGALHRAASRH